MIGIVKAWLAKSEDERLSDPHKEPVILGLLLAEVAKADGDYSKHEDARIVEILRGVGEMSEDDAKLALDAAHEARAGRHDLQGFTREIKSLKYPERLNLLGLLFEVAFVDDVLAPEELSTIRKVAQLLWVNDNDFAAVRVAAREKRELENRRRPG